MTTLNILLGVFIKFLSENVIIVVLLCYTLLLVTDTNTLVTQGYENCCNEKEMKQIIAEIC